MKHVLTLLAALLLMPMAALHAADAKKPNIILIFADDLGWKDVGYQGSDFYETPHLNALAKQSMVFSAAYAAAGNCAPSRACLLSGNYTPRHQVYAVGTTNRGPKESQRLIPIKNKSGLAPANVTMADALKAAGYATGHFGKWHLSGKDGAPPTEQGFDVSFGATGKDGEKESRRGKKEGQTEDPKGVFALTRKAGEFITANKERPFFCYLAHHAIHAPLQGRAETLAKFKAKKTGAQHNDALYAACLYDLDASVGILLDKLKELGLEDNTLLVFTSDNGGTSQSSQEPLRGNKGSYYEGGIREPFIVRWPGVTVPGSHSDVPAINVDLYPTFLAAAGATPPEGKVLDGENLIPLFKGATTLARQSIFWHFPGYLDSPVTRGRELDVQTGFRSRPVSVIHKGEWKLHLYHEEWQLDGGREKLKENHAVELYRLADDIGERKDLANTETAKRDELLDELLAWTHSSEAIFASEPNPKFSADATKAAGRKGKKKPMDTEP